MDESKREQLKTLVSNFSRNIVQYKSGSYDESNTRADFIDKLFTLLDWDVANDAGDDERYRDVVREDKITIGGNKKSPDYSFRIGGIVKFYVEAKKPSVNIKDEPEPAFQVRRYAYTAKLPLSILTNFKEFAVYDTRIKPNEKDHASAARVFYCTYEEYEKHFDFIYNTFSIKAIRQGSFDKYVEDNRNKKGTSPVDDELLAVIEEWRVELAKNIAKNNPRLSIYNLNTIVQKIIDRIIFIRIAEDRGIEEEDLLLSIAKTNSIYEKLNHIFTKVNIKYNSEIFAYQEWEERVKIDDKVLSNIIVNLYYPKCPYEFSVLPVEILGSIYERFLGKTIRFRGIKGDTHASLRAARGRKDSLAAIQPPTRTAIIEEKPEVKKAGGVFYTPQYIVNYIVENTVGEKIKNKRPEHIAQIKIVDPACGSGSFLVGAYQYLLNYHLDYYSKKENVDAALKSKKIYKYRERSYKLTIEEKQHILINNIFGVDIDNQAVEVTKLSLYLKLLEDEEKGWLINYSNRALLPVLETNIKCGNSLIGTDFYTQGDLDFSDEERIKVNCFDWEKEFADIFKCTGGRDAAGIPAVEFAKQTPNIESDKDVGFNVGFDVVIGNPPYVNAKALVEIYKNERNYLSSSPKYKCLFQKWDLYIAFIEKSLQILKSEGSFSMIIPYPFINQNYGALLRRLIFEKHKIVKILDLSNKKVFKDAVVTNIILNIQKEKKGDKIQIDKIADLTNKIYNAYYKEKDSFIQDDNISSWDISNDKKISLNKNNFYMFGDICFISKGLVLNADEKYAKGKFVKKDLISNKKTAIHIKRYIEAKNMDRYIIKNILYLEWNTTRVPRKISRPTFVELYENPKLMINKLGNLKAIFDKTKIYCDQTIRVAVLWKHLKKVHNNSISKFLVKPRVELEIISTNYDGLFLLGILNSKITFHLLNQIRGVGNIDINPDYLKQLPIPIIDLSNKTDKTKQDNIVSLVDKMQELKKREAGEPNPQQKTMITRQIKGIDEAIDNAVYELYGLSEDEIKIVEGV